MDGPAGIARAVAAGRSACVADVPRCGRRGLGALALYYCKVTEINWFLLHKREKHHAETFFLIAPFAVSLFCLIFAALKH
jgi:hypothetical protein